MKKLPLTFISFLFLTNIFGQKTEFSVSLNSGLFKFTGQSAVRNSFINYSNSTNNGYTNNPYGSNVGLCYGLSANLKRVTKYNLILGFDVGLETLRSKVFIDRISGFTGTSTYEYPATGKSFLNNDFVNIYPSIGYRINLNQISLDINGGFDLAYGFKSTETGDAIATNGTGFITSLERHITTSDIRPRIQLSIAYQKTGIYIGYSEGSANYMAGMVGGTNESFGRLIRFGLSYRVK
jgi:hypothetical protein